MLKEFVLLTLTMVPGEPASWDDAYVYSCRAACESARTTIEDRHAGQKYTVKGTCTENWHGDMAQPTE